jgi:AcrR family transcriptional regulator
MNVRRRKKDRSPLPPGATAAPRAQRTNATLLDAAVRLFVTHGFRRATMEGLALEAGVAKATVYARYRDKAEAFDAAVTHISQGMTQRADAAARKARSSRAAVLASLVHKQVELFELLQRSSHAQELLGAARKEGAQAMAAAHATYQAALVPWLRGCPGVTRAQAPQLARLLDEAAEGLGNRAASQEDLRAQLKLLVDRVLR